MFGKKTKSSGGNDDVAMRIVTNGAPREVTFRELALSTNMSLEALMSVLIKKSIITPEELLDEIENRQDSSGSAAGADRSGDE